MQKILRQLRYLFLIFLIGRSASDAFSQQLASYFTSMRITISALVDISLAVVGITYLGILFFKKKLVLDRVSWFFLGWVLSLAPWVYLTAYNFQLAGLRGVKEWIRLLILVVVFITSFSIAKRADIRKVINFMLFALPIPLSVAYYQIISNPQDRAYGTMVHPNALALFMVVMIGITIWKFQQKGHLSPLYGGVLLLEIPALIASVSSNGWLMFVVFLFVLMLTVKGGYLKVIPLVGGLVLVLFLIMMLINPGITKEFSTLWQTRSLAEILASRQEINTLEGRIWIWSKLIGEWRQHPLVGYGLNTSKFINPVTGKAPHNDYVRYLTECGVFGLLAFVAFQFCVGWALFQRYKKIEDGDLKFLAGICFSLFVGWMVASLGDNVINVTSFQVYFWALIAVVSGGYFSGTETSASSK